MPIIRSRYQGADGLVGVEAKGDDLVFHHIQRLDPIMRECAEKRKDPSKGYSSDGSLRQIASIPESAYLAHPEFVLPSGQLNRDAVYKWLDSPEGELFKTVPGSARHA
jgi:hypothetical protein